MSESKVWNGIQVKRIQFDDTGRITVIEFYESAGLTDVIKAITQYRINGGSPRMIEEALILTDDEKSPKQNVS